MPISTADLRRFAPTASASIVAAIVTNWPYAESHGISTPLRLQHFLSQVADETGGLRQTEESLNYTTVAQIRKTWPTRFPTDKSAQPYVRNPKELAIQVYGGRLGNAPAPSTDGWDYRGGGMLQDTGRAAYRANGHESDPEYIREPNHAFADAVDWWTAHDCNTFADKDDCPGLTRHINGGLIGLSTREAYLAKAKRVWTTAPAPAVRKPGGLGLVSPAVASDTIPTYDTILAVQNRLRELGYTEVGVPDGTLDDLTQTAILAFRKDQALPLTPTIDSQLSAALLTAAPRQMSAARTDASPADVRAVVPEARASWRTKIYGMSAAVVGGVGSAGQFVVSNFQDLRDKVQPFQDFLTDVPSWVWFVAILGAGVGIWIASHQGEKAAQAAYQTGARR